MSFGEFETSAYQGEPVELYLFRYGAPDECVLGYNDGEHVITADGDRPGLTVEYLPKPLDRTEISASGTLDRARLEVLMPDDTELAALFKYYPPSHVVTLVVFQGHHGDPDNQFIAAWAGRVVAFATEDNTAKFTCEPVSTSLKRVGLRRRWQYGCPHVLYGPKCKATKTIFEKSVLAVSGPLISLASDWVLDDLKPKFAGGIAEWTLPDGRTEIRTILRSEVDGTLLLASRAKGLDAGMLVRVALGCNHLSGTAAQPIGDCGPLHGNIVNFGGQPWIPSKSPTGIQNIYW